ncbi:hypothetical protein [Jidongwangia harbinensis]|uniref:hypothetical protein n=1 Tax=Jidongwangia harbinensis TaxID=2878561 RepID=UPI001CDA4861|nr:hypothetical protein [Jidongwangia harbinensis]MCA2214482.1 hypothetical protein [Jidongwangia harbinensis]
MHTLRRPHVDATVLGAAPLLALALSNSRVDIVATQVPPGPGDPSTAGTWRSADGEVDLELDGDGTYRLRLAGRRRPASGTFRADGRTVVLYERSGLRTHATLVDGAVLEMAGRELFRVLPD